MLYLAAQSRSAEKRRSGFPGDLTHKAEAKSRQLEPCDSDASAQHALYLHEDDTVDLCNGGLISLAM